MTSLNSSLLCQEEKVHWKIKLGKTYQRERNYRETVDQNVSYLRISNSLTGQKMEEQELELCRCKEGD